MNSEKNMLGSNTKTKVSSYTQVEPEFVGTDIRRIVGQEDIHENYLSKHLQDLSLNKQNKGIRPPLVGQASSSSNDSVSLPFEERHSDVENTEQAVPPYQAGSAEAFAGQQGVGLNGINFTRGTFSTPFLLNREDYINQRPPEGSSDQIGMVGQPLENAQDFPRLRSPSSASSVTSSRPLEWDSGADVGYNQLYVVNGKTVDQSMSTLERMALACGTNLLMRSDPEGTTGPSGQPQTVYKSAVQSKFRSKNKLGFPNAESTPLGTCPTSDISPETGGEDMISPILSDNIDKVLDIENSPSTSSLDEYEDSASKPKSKDFDGKKNVSPTDTKNIRSKVPLFPEIIHSLPQTSHKDNLEEFGLINSQQSHRPNEKEQSVKIDTGTSNLKCEPHQQVEDGLPPNFNKELNNKLSSLLLENESNFVGNNSNKKISSSLENVSTYTDAPSDTKSHSNTLPRSQGQVNLFADKLAHEDDDKNTNCPKYNMALHSLMQYNKSASSSSISTVVHRKGDSPKHMFVQTSLLKQESVGVQVCEENDIRPTVFTATHCNDTPHLPKTTLTQQFPKRSNYFNFDSKCDKKSDGNHIAVFPHGARSIEENQMTRSNEPLSHSHNGIPCTGAHKKVPCPVRQNSKLSLDHAHHIPILGKASVNLTSNVPANHNRPAIQGLSSSINNNKLFGTAAMDSVESSAKSGGGWTENQYSVTVEDRVNSFEYLPGHVYENTERQQPIDSQRTSSISIQNQTSNNESLDDRGRTWDSSMSATSNLEKDVQRGVEIISDFVKGSCANDSMLKKKLIRRVVEKLISKNYAEDSVRPEDLTSNVPWVPSRPPNPVPLNGRETRRSVNRSKVPCEFSSRSERSGSTNTSSECFIPAASSKFLPSSLRDNTCVAGQGSHSSTSEISIEKSSKSHGKPPPSAFDGKTQVIQNGSIARDVTDSSSSKSVPPRNWKEPATKSEKLLEEKRKMRGGSCTSQTDDMTLTKYLNLERENRLFWIRSEIQHLNNLKELLEKQEELKRGIKAFKTNQRSSGKSVLKDRNAERVDRAKDDSSSSRTSDARKKTSTPKTQSKYRPTLSTWLEKTATNAKTNPSKPSEASTDNGTEDWMSHHYRSENNENLRSCMKRKSKHQTQKSDKRLSSEEKRDSVIYDEPPLHSYKPRGEEAKQPRPPATPYRPRTGVSQVDESVFITEKGVEKKNAQTETLDTVGVQTSNSVQQMPVLHPTWFRHKHKRRESQHGCECACRGGCRCCGNRKEAPRSNEEEEVKPPLGYYITFEPSPREPDKTRVEQRPLEEVRIPVPMSEPKKKPSRRLRAGSEIRDSERVRPGESERVIPGLDLRRSESESASSQSDAGRSHSVKPTFQGATGMLQYYLLHNRPAYVSRAEDRRQCIVQMKYLRELRDHSKRRLLSLTEPVAQSQLPPPPLGVTRVFSQQTMRRQTERKYRQLAEVRNRQQDTKRKEGYRTNRLMAEIFKKKLQKRVLKGEVNLSNSVSVISSL